MIDLFTKMIEVDTERGIIIVITILFTIAVMTAALALRQIMGRNSRMVEQVTRSTSEQAPEVLEGANGILNTVFEQQNRFYIGLDRLVEKLDSLGTELKTTNQNFGSMQSLYEEHINLTNETLSRLTELISLVRVDMKTNQQITDAKIESETAALQTTLEKILVAIEGLAPSIQEAIKPMLDEMSGKISELKETVHGKTQEIIISQIDPE